MDERYIAKVVQRQGLYEVIINKGSQDGVKENMRFLVVGIGEDIIDPDTGDSLGKLEIVKSAVRVKHIQDKISTLVSDEFSQPEAVTEIKKVTSTGLSGIASFMGNGNTTTESTTPGRKVQLELSSVEKGDFIIRK